MPYHLALPERMEIHHTFHVNFLKQYQEDVDMEHAKPKRAPLTVHKELGREVEHVLD